MIHREHDIFKADERNAQCHSTKWNNSCSRVRGASCSSPHTRPADHPTHTRIPAHTTDTHWRCKTTQHETDTRRIRSPGTGGARRAARSPSSSTESGALRTHSWAALPRAVQHSSTDLRTRGPHRARVPGSRAAQTARLSGPVGRRGDGEPVRRADAAGPRSAPLGVECTRPTGGHSRPLGCATYQCAPPTERRFLTSLYAFLPSCH